MNEVEIIVTSKDRTDRGFADAERRAHGFGSVMAKVGDIIGTLFTKGVSAAVDMGMNLFKTFFNKTSEAAASMATNVATSIGSAVTSGSAMTVATGGLNLLVGALLAVAAASAVVTTGFVALAPLVSLVGGLVAAAAGGMVGLAGSVAVLKMGLSGLGDAFGEVMENGEATDETLKKLSPNARSLVHEFERIAPALSGLRKFVQDQLLEGMSAQFRDLSSKWLPALEPILDNIAGSFNRVGKSLFEALGDTTFIRNMQEASSGFADMIDRIGLGLDDFVDGFGRLAGASVPVLQKIGELIGGVLEKFGAWMKSADESGALDAFMQRAAATLQDIWDIGGLVLSIGKQIVEIFFPSSAKTSDSFLGGAKVMLQEVRDWLADPENQTKIQEWIDKIGEFAAKASTEWVPMLLSLVETVAEWVDKVQSWADKIVAFKDSVSEAWDNLKTRTEEVWNSIVEFFTSLPERAGSALAELPGKVREKVEEMATGAAERVGFMIGTVIGFMLTLPGRAAEAIAALPGFIRDKFNQAREFATSAVTTLVSSVVGFLASLPGRASSAISALPGLVSGVFNSARNSASSAMSSMVSTVASIAKSIPGRVASAIGSLGGILVSAGRSLIQGLINGIESQIGPLRSKLQAITNLIPDWKGPLDVDKRILEPSGAALLDGLMRGISSRVPDLRDQLQGITGSIPAMAGGASGTTVPASAGILTPNGQGVTVNLYVQGSIRSDRDLVALIRDEFINGGFRGLVAA